MESLEKGKRTKMNYRVILRHPIEYIKMRLFFWRINRALNRLEKNLKKLLAETRQGWQE